MLTTQALSEAREAPALGKVSTPQTFISSIGFNVPEHLLRPHSIKERPLRLLTSMLLGSGGLTAFVLSITLVNKYSAL